MFKLVTVILDLVFLAVEWFIDRRESDEFKKTQIKNEVANAFKIKDRKERASRLNAIVHDLNRRV